MSKKQIKRKYLIGDKVVLHKREPNCTNTYLHHTMYVVLYESDEMPGSGTDRLGLGHSKGDYCSWYTNPKYMRPAHNDKYINDDVPIPF